MVLEIDGGLGRIYDNISCKRMITALSKTYKALLSSLNFGLPIFMIGVWESVKLRKQSFQKPNQQDEQTPIKKPQPSIKKPHKHWTYYEVTIHS